MQTAKEYRKAVFGKTWELSKERLAWQEPIIVGAIGLFIAAWRRESWDLSEIMNWLWALSAVVLYWAGVLLFNLIRAPFRVNQDVLARLPPEQSTPTGPPRDFTEASVKRLTGLYDGNTALQARALIAPYLGKWIRVSVVVDRIDGDGVRVSIGGNDVNKPAQKETFPYFEQGHGVAASFDKKWEGRFLHLKAGDTIHLIGRIGSIDDHMIHLRDAELSDRPSPR